MAKVHDLKASHPDFELPLSGNSHEQGIVEELLGADDTPVYGSHASTKTTSGAANFYAWFHDVPDVSQTIDGIPLPLSASSNQPGFFEYRKDAFFPIDDRGFGNESWSHNFHFTLETSFHFRYVGGEVFRFQGDDDLWVFINRHLVMDLGGTHQSLSDEVLLDDVAARVGLQRNGVYTLNLFFAERHTTESHFAIETTIADPGTCE